MLFSCRMDGGRDGGMVGWLVWLYGCGITVHHRIHMHLAPSSIAKLPSFPETELHRTTWTGSRHMASSYLLIPTILSWKISCPPSPLPMGLACLSVCGVVRRVIRAKWSTPNNRASFGLRKPPVRLLRPALLHSHFGNRLQHNRPIYHDSVQSLQFHHDAPEPPHSLATMMPLLFSLVSVRCLRIAITCSQASFR